MQSVLSPVPERGRRWYGKHNRGNRLGHGGSSGHTWGKKFAGIRVVHESGAPLGYIRALIRWAVAIGLTILLIIPNLIDVLWPLWDSKKQALRDKAVGSIVVYA